MQTYWVQGNEGAALDARADVDGRSVSLHSRGGSTGGRPPRNTQYELALAAICRRATRDGNYIERILIDSKTARESPEEDRVLLKASDIEALDPEHLVSVIRSKLRQFGQASDTKGGNSTKRVRFDFRHGKPIQLLKLRVTPSPVPAPNLIDPIQTRAQIRESADDPSASAEVKTALDALDPTDEDRRFVEGSLRRVGHLRRERDSALVAKKRGQFLAKHGNFHCEACGNDWIELYGPEIAAGCFDVHHAATLVKDMEVGHISRVEDLMLLCANCHRAEHQRMRLEN